MTIQRVFEPFVNRPKLNQDCIAHKEEADDRILFHLSYGVKFEKYSIVKITSSDTDVFVSSTYHFQQLKYFDWRNFGS